MSFVRDNAMKKDLIKDALHELVDQKWTPGIVAASGSKINSAIYSYGYTSDDKSTLVDKSTLIDLASVTKIITLIFVMSLYDKRMIDLNKTVSYYSSKFQNIGSLKIYELMNFTKTLVTPVRLDTDSNNLSILDRIYNVEIQSNDTKYSDIGSIVLSTLIDDLYGKEYFRNKMKELWQEAGLKRTYWWDEITENTNIYNYDKEFRIVNDELITISTPVGIVHDQKARKIGACGHAGIFSCADDIAFFSKAILNGELISQNAIKIITSDKYDSFDVEGQHYGILCLKKTNNKYNEIPPISSEHSIALSGYTGTYYHLDFLNRKYIFIGGNRLANRLTSEETKKFQTNTKYIKCTKRFAYEKDKLRDFLNIS